MGKTAILECPHCKGLMLAAADAKTKLCPYCGSRVDLRKAKRVARAESAMEASELLKKIKADRQSNPHKPRENSL